MADREERTEQPTSERRREARRAGRVARSHDLAVATSLLGVFLLLGGWGPSLARHTLTFTREMLSQVKLAPDILAGEGLAAVGVGVAVYLAYCALPVALIAVAFVVISQVGQGAWVFVPHSVTPQIGRLDPLEGTRRLASLRSCFRGVFAGLKLAVVGACLWKAIDSHLGKTAVQVATLGTTWKAYWDVLIGFGIHVSVSLVLLAILDYVVQRWLYERSLRMTRDEIREEARRQEGDQSIKDRRRRFTRAPESRPAEGKS